MFKRAMDKWSLAGLTVMAVAPITAMLLVERAANWLLDTAKSHPTLNLGRLTD